MSIQNTSLVGLALLALSFTAACGSDSKKGSGVPSSESIAGRSSYTTTDDKILLPEGLELKGVSAECNLSIPASLSYSRNSDGKSFSFGSYSGKATRSLPRHTMLAEENESVEAREVLGGDYSFRVLDGAVAKEVRFSFADGQLDVAVTCQY